MLSQLLYEVARAAEKQEQLLSYLEDETQKLKTRIQILETEKYQDEQFFTELSEMMYKKYHKKGD